MSYVSTSGIDTGISVNANSFGKTLLIISSTHGASGDATVSNVDMIRCGYDGDNWHVVNIASSSGVVGHTKAVDFELSSSGTIVLKNPTGTASYVTIISTRKL